MASAVSSLVMSPGVQSRLGQNTFQLSYTWERSHFLEINSYDLYPDCERVNGQVHTLLDSSHTSYGSGPGSNFLGQHRDPLHELHYLRY